MEFFDVIKTRQVICLFAPAAIENGGDEVEVVGMFSPPAGGEFPRIAETHEKAPPQYPAWDEEGETDEEVGAYCPGPRSFRLPFTSGQGPLTLRRMPSPARSGSAHKSGHVHAVLGGQLHQGLPGAVGQ